MPSIVHWVFALALGVVVTAATWTFADWRVAAVTTGLLWVVAGLLSTRAWEDLDSRVETTTTWQVALWQGVTVAVLPFVVLPASAALELSLRDEVGVSLLVGGVGFLAFFAGIGTTLAYFDRAERGAVDSDALSS